MHLLEDYIETKKDKRGRQWRFYVSLYKVFEESMLYPAEYEQICTLASVQIRSRKGTKTKEIEYCGIKAQEHFEAQPWI